MNLRIACLHILGSHRILCSNLSPYKMCPGEGQQASGVSTLWGRRNREKTSRCLFWKKRHLRCAMSAFCALMKFSQLEVFPTLSLWLPRAALGLIYRLTGRQISPQSEMYLQLTSKVKVGELSYSDGCQDDGNHTGKIPALGKEGERDDLWHLRSLSILAWQNRKSQWAHPELHFFRINTNLCFLPSSNHPDFFLNSKVFSNPHIQ